MCSVKEKFMKIKSSNEFDQRKNEFLNLDYKDHDVDRHFRELIKNDFMNRIAGINQGLFTKISSLETVRQ